MSILSFLSLKAFRPELDSPRYPLERRLRAHKVRHLNVTIFGDIKLSSSMEFSQGQWSLCPSSIDGSARTKESIPCHALMESKSILCESREFPGGPAAEVESYFAEQMHTNPGALLKGGLHEDGRAYHIIPFSGTRWALVFSVTDNEVHKATDEIRKQSGIEPVGVTAGLAAAAKLAMAHVGTHLFSNGLVIVASQKHVLLLLVKSGRFDTEHVSLRSVEDADSLHEVQGYAQEELLKMVAEGLDSPGAILFTTPSSILTGATFNTVGTTCSHVPLTSKDLCFA